MKSKSKLMLGDNMESLKKLPDNSIDSIVSDPPYGLSFMNKKWDYDVPSVEFWKEVYRVLKPGGHILSFGGTRTYHRMVVNIEDAGFEIRDQVMWLYGSGFPKSHNIGKAVDKIKGNEREVVGTKNDFALDGRVRNPDIHKPMNETINSDQQYGYKQGWETPVTKGQSKYEGWGTALKPANEPICVARKPLSEKTIADNVIKWGTGGINIDGCRVGSDTIKIQVSNSEGRFPANIILDETAAELLDEQSGMVGNNWKKNYGKEDYTGKQYDTSTNQCVFGGGYTGNNTYADKGGASRFFYVTKVSKKERNLGLDGFEEKDKLEGKDLQPSKNNHPTLKPINLMTYLCRLITPEGGIVLDPFMGSGSTGISALLEGFRFIGMEMDKDYFKIAEARINSYEDYRKLLKK